MSHRPAIRLVRPRASSVAPWSAAVGARLRLFRRSGDVAPLLRERRVAVIGVGSVGYRVADHLARLGVADLLLVDPKPFKPESILTHPIGPAEVSKWKARVAARHCQRISPRTRVAWFVGSVHELPLDALADVDAVVQATDNHIADVETGQRCLHLGRPLIQAALQPELLVVQVRCFSNADAAGSCPACSFGPADWDLAHRQVRYSCEGAGAIGARAIPVADPASGSLAFLCSLAADLAVNQLLRRVLDLGVAVDDTALEICGFTNRTVTTALKRNPDCRCDHTRFAVVKAFRLLHAHSVTSLATLAGWAGHEEPVSLRVGGYRWVERAACVCRDDVRVDRFVREGADGVGRCAKCHSALRPLSFYTRGETPLAALGDAAQRTLRDLGARRARYVILRAGARTMMIRDAGSTRAEIFETKEMHVAEGPVVGRVLDPRAAVARARRAGEEAFSVPGANPRPELEVEAPPTNP